MRCAPYVRRQFVVVHYTNYYELWGVRTGAYFLAEIYNVNFQIPYYFIYSLYNAQDRAPL